MITLLLLHLTSHALGQSLEFFSGSQCTGADQQIISPAEVGQCYSIPADVGGIEMTQMQGTTSFQTFQGGLCTTAYGIYETNKTCVPIEGENITGVAFGGVGGGIKRAKHLELHERDHFLDTDEEHGLMKLQGELEERATLTLLVFSVGAGFVFGGLNGVATSCIGGDYSSPRQATATGISCVINVLQVAFGAWLSARTHAGIAAELLSLSGAKRDGSRSIEFEHEFGTGLMYQHPAYNGTFMTRENPAHIYLNKDDPSTHHIYYKHGNRHTVRKGVGYNIDPTIQHSKRSDPRLDIYYDWETDDVNSNPTQSDTGTLAQDYVTWMQNNPDYDEACVAVCNGGTISQGPAPQNAI
ncbi:hypothetical protein PRZ48_005517 [Zasmidium cellare]|uniref:Uncharacterized protein n=1 Tax=Zasmidium cellare TaxID=395010 RepID=A0ABR0ESK8_ZASCE|nr:hypothetical protein PRZ48_005517 [Zasmidium cellare]